MSRQVPHEYARCRAWGHVWEFTTVDQVGKEKFVQGLRCTYCRTERSATIGRGQRLNKYKYPEQIYDDVEPYKMPHGTGGALTTEERCDVTLGEIHGRYDELGVRRRKRKRA